MLIILGNLVNTILKAVWAEDGGSPHGLVVDGERLPPRTMTVSVTCCSPKMESVLRTEAPPSKVSSDGLPRPPRNQDDLKQVRPFSPVCTPARSPHSQVPQARPTPNTTS